MSDDNAEMTTFSCDSFEEFEMEMVEPSESEIQFVPHSSMIIDEEKIVATLQRVLDDFLADRSCWEPPPATIRGAFERLREKLRERMKS